MTDANKKKVAGRLDKNRAGFAFLIRDDGIKPDIYIRRNNQKNAMDNDHVRVEITSGIRSPKPEGRVVSIIKRASDILAGTVKTNGGPLRFIPLGSSEKFQVKRNKLSKTVRDGDRAVFRVLRMPSLRKNALGEIIRILGPAGEYETEISVTLIHTGIRSEFSKGSLREAENIPEDIHDTVMKDREDLRGLNCFTIDPKSARDFDDAVSIEKKGSGYELGVHIADVSHYAVEGSSIDREAYERGTSVYMVDRVIPMLPERLSNELCSLKPGKDRLAMSVLINLEKDGELKGFRFSKSLIRSKRRFTYREIDSFLEGKLALDKRTGSDITSMVSLAKALRSRRDRRGAIDFDFPDLKVILNSDGSVGSVRREERKTSHRLIEEFMILANETVASFLEENRVPCLFRVHDKPDEEKLEAFRNFISLFGFTVPRKKKLSPRDLQLILNQIRQSREEIVISTMMLRSLKQAVYSGVNRGHFALASESYAHFTSPIRRYPDLIVHRILNETIRNGGMDNAKKKFVKSGLDNWGKHLSERERAADDAETESRELKLMEHMKNMLGDVFSGIISGVTSFGIFVELEETGLEGLIRVKDLKDDYYKFIETEMLLRGKRSRAEFRIGDEIRVRLVRIDMIEREVDFMPAGPAEAEEKQSVSGR